jgi:hypothetical protein
MRLNGLVRAGPDPGPNDVRIAALLEAGEKLLKGVGFHTRHVGRRTRISALRCKQRLDRIDQTISTGASHLRNVVLAERGTNDIGQKITVLSSF